MRNWTKLAALVVTGALLAVFGVAAELKAGTEVKLAFDQDLSSKTAKAGDRVRLVVLESVLLGGQEVIVKGTRVTAIVAEVRQRGRWGKNGMIKLSLHPVVAVGKEQIPLQPRQKGKEFKGSQTDKAAIATGGGLVLLGPVGALGGYFIPGKDVELRKGDKMDTEVARDVPVEVPTEEEGGVGENP